MTSIVLCDVSILVRYELRKEEEKISLPFMGRAGSVTLCLCCVHLSFSYKK